MLNMLENIKEMSLRHTSADFLLEFRQPFGLDACRQFLQVRRSVFIDAQFAVGRKSRVNLGGEARQFSLQRGGEIHAALGDAEGSAVGRQSWFAFRPGQELGAVVGEFLGAHDIAIAGLQSISEIDEDADLKRTSVKNDGSDRRLMTKLCQRCEAKPRSTLSCNSSRRVWRCLLTTAIASSRLRSCVADWMSSKSISRNSRLRCLA